MIKTIFKCRNRGSNLIEYVVPIALIGVLVGVSIFYMASKGNLLKYFSSSSAMEVDQTGNKIIIGSESGNISALVSQKANNQDDSSQDNNKVSGSSISEKKECVNGSCTLDLGGVTLKGIPEDFNDYVRTVGTPGSTDLIADLIAQVATQLEDQGLTEESEEVKKLASFGHNIASVEKTFESTVINCNYEKECIEGFINTNKTIDEKTEIIVNKKFAKPEGFDETYMSFPDDAKYYDMLYSMSIGTNKDYEINNHLQFDENLAGNNLASLFVKQMNIINQSDNINPEVKAVIEELYWDIGVIGEDCQNMISAITTNYEAGFAGDLGNRHFDPITGDYVLKGLSDNPISDFVNYNASGITHFDSALICASGNHSDSGKKCH